MSTPQREQRDTVPGTLGAGWSAVLLLLAVVVSGLRAPWGLLACVPALGALVLSARTAWVRQRAGHTAAAIWAGVGILFALYVLAGTVVQGVLYGPIDDYRSCSVAANTDVAQQDCVDALRARLGAGLAELVR